MRLRAAFAVCAFMLIAAPARAAPDEAAYAAFAAGDYEGAAMLADNAGGAENEALAARAINAVAYFEDDRKTARDLSARALDYAEAAVKADPKLPEGYLQAAIAIALRGARMAPPRAFLANIPGRSRRYLDQALAIDPDNPWALSTSAAWRLEVARRGGGVYGAVPEEGYKEFTRARALAPKNVVIAYECALRLLASGRKEWRGDALACLDAAIENPAEIASDKGVQARAEGLKQAVAGGPKVEAQFIAAQP